MVVDEPPPPLPTEEPGADPVLLPPLLPMPLDGGVDPLVPLPVDPPPPETLDPPPPPDEPAPVPLPLPSKDVSV